MLALPIIAQKDWNINNGIPTYLIKFPSCIFNIGMEWHVTTSILSETLNLSPLNKSKPFTATKTAKLTRVSNVSIPPAVRGVKWEFECMPVT